MILTWQQLVQVPRRLDPRRTGWSWWSRCEGCPPVPGPAGSLFSTWKGPNAHPDILSAQPDICCTGIHNTFRATLSMLKCRKGSIQCCDTTNFNNAALIINKILMDCFILHRTTVSIFTFQKEVLFYQYDRKQDERGNHKKKMLGIFYHECWKENFVALPPI